MTELEQFIAKLEELERTMTKGHYARFNGRLFVGHVIYNADDTATVEGDPEGGCLAEGWPTIIEGLAHLKNSNPTVCAMLKAAMKELQGVVEYWNGAPESAVDAIETVADRAHNCLAHLNTLAAEALGTTGEK